MGSDCSRSFHSSSSPRLPSCEVLRRCLRQLCPMEPDVRKEQTRVRKYELSDIVVKRDSWAQTDCPTPLPPPRHKRHTRRPRRRSRSLDFLPYLISRETPRASLADLGDQEDAFNFQMFFMSHLPRESVDQGRERLSGRKKKFLSELLGNETSTLSVYSEKSAELEEQDETKSKEDKKAEEKILEGGETNMKVETSESLSQGEGKGSRRSSITESLKEFESSLFDNLQEDVEEEEEGRAGGKEVKYGRASSVQAATRTRSQLGYVPEEAEQESVVRAVPAPIGVS